MSNQLPEPFTQLTPYRQWGLPTEEARMRRRITASMADLTDYYQAMLPHIDAIAEHLNQWSLAELPNEQKPLLYMAMMFMEAAVSVEIFYEADVPEALGAEHIDLYAGRAEQLVNS
ncbi:MAG: hypothetical protein VW985_07735 [Gammaproteobacteria bacterium]